MAVAAGAALVAPVLAAMSMWPAEIQSSLMVYILGDPLHDIRCLLAEHSGSKIQKECKFGEVALFSIYPH